jgi:hypothetical protein
MAAPKAVPNARPARMAAMGWKLWFSISVAMKIVVKARTEPTLRSMPPDRMTKVMPTAMTPTCALFMNRFTTTRMERKFVKKIEKTPKSAISTNAVTSMGRFSRRIFMRRRGAGRVGRGVLAIAGGRR